MWPYGIAAVARSTSRRKPLERRQSRGISNAWRRRSKYSSSSRRVCVSEPLRGVQDARRDAVGELLQHLVLVLGGQAQRGRVPRAWRRRRSSRAACRAARRRRRSIPSARPRPRGRGGCGPRRRERSSELAEGRFQLSLVVCECSCLGDACGHAFVRSVGEACLRSRSRPLEHVAPGRGLARPHDLGDLPMREIGHVAEGDRLALLVGQSAHAPPERAVAHGDLPFVGRAGRGRRPARVRGRVGGACRRPCAPRSRTATSGRPRRRARRRRRAARRASSPGRRPLPAAARPAPRRSAARPARAPR